ncbi:Vacuolar cation/proton exchanger 2 [Tetrabaena socialis]|uniref:Vacuolar cation/proton exchanger 2 n=1 Tax=Tetrabaena socialis TaxID=47790 RepID=A0A2J8AA38_9CHLO|nr:Vacuolar cation/proton exchanger 2 [Tetrabaena socialis]|eukprot:PNH09365.1 Vacuolar cation/proton exchanger 2 [Tetrabaena socialis]
MAPAYASMRLTGGVPLGGTMERARGPWVAQFKLEARAVEGLNGDAHLVVHLRYDSGGTTIRLGFVTEQLAMYTNDTIGGLLNATFGNATEMIISGFALAQARNGGGETYLRVVQLSLLGSVVSNLLLVMGTAFIAGGFRVKVQKFNQAGINVNSGMLVLSTFAVLLPSLLDATHSEQQQRSSSGRSVGKGAGGGERDIERLPLVLAAERAGGLDAHSEDERPLGGSSKDGDEEEEECVLSKTGCFLWLTGVTIIIAFLSEFVTDAIRVCGCHKDSDLTATDMIEDLPPASAPPSPMPTPLR